MEAENDTKDTGPVGTRIDHRTGQRIYLYDAAHWRGHVEKRNRLGVSVHEYCTESGLALSTFRSWAHSGGRKVALAPKVLIDPGTVRITCVENAYASALKNRYELQYDQRSAASKAFQQSSSACVK